ncbi:unnamed protein product, partial [Gulo gulo]
FLLIIHIKKNQNLRKDTQEIRLVAGWSLFLSTLETWEGCCHLLSLLGGRNCTRHSWHPLIGPSSRWVLLSSLHRIASGCETMF